MKSWSISMCSRYWIHNFAVLEDLINFSLYSSNIVCSLFLSFEELTSSAHSAPPSKTFLHKLSIWSFRISESSLLSSKGSSILSWSFGSSGKHRSNSHQYRSKQNVSKECSRDSFTRHHVFHCFWRVYRSKSF